MNFFFAIIRGLPAFFGALIKFFPVMWEVFRYLAEQKKRSQLESAAKAAKETKDTSELENL